jgi:malonyl-CoA/methylmalonyl-CoA synthetase
MANPLSDALILRRRDASRTLLVTPAGRSWCYADFVASTGRIANALRQRGIAAGDRVLVQVEKSPEALALYGACLRLGAVMAPFSTGRSAAEMAEFVDELSPRLVVRDASLEAPLPQAASMTLNADGSGTLREAASREHASFDDVARAPDDVAIILYTSGTTGRSKGCVLSHNNLLSNARALSETWKIAGSDVLLHLMPLYHIHGLLISTNALLAASASMLFVDRFVPSQTIELMPRATIMMGTPQQYAELLASDGFGRQATTQMRLFVSGGELLSPKTMALFEERCGHRILERHAMTELGVSASNPYFGNRKCGTVGMPLPDVSLRIADHQSGVVMPPGRAGILEVKGPNVFLGYWQRPDLTAEAMRPDGYFVTGDVARFDGDGYLEILGRSDDIIICDGRQISAREIEAVIDAAPGVQESAVIGVEHAEYGQAIVGIVVSKPAATPSECGVLAYASARLSADFCPAKIVFADRLPKSSTGKLQKRILRETYRGLYSGYGADA